ncbi:SoxR reducing system RseC family protein [Thalassotalea atypica]|uniref:SoxR reducing system RseC family protein n=1 Tax=Thalassotalea atypica TaxID=2054316 RepID=UPI002573FD58|nr:SoxR reducing system RseC family protein [Thalassotalea atypica]
MIEERAVVKELFPDAIMVESVIKSTCSQCHQVDNCGNGQVAKALPQKKLSLLIPTTERFVVGDELIIAIPERFLLQSAWQVYMWPLLGLLICAGGGQYLLNKGFLTHELYVVGFALLGGFSGSKLAKWWQDYSGLQKKLVPKILKTAPKNIETLYVS